MQCLRLHWLNWTEISGSGFSTPWLNSLSPLCAGLTVQPTRSGKCVSAYLSSTCTCRSVIMHRMSVGSYSGAVLALSPHLCRTRPPHMWHRFAALSANQGVWMRFTFGEACSEYSCKPWNAIVCFYWTNNTRHKQGFVRRTLLWSFLVF